MGIFDQWVVIDNGEAVRSAPVGNYERAVITSEILDIEHPDDAPHRVVRFPLAAS